MVSVRVNVQGVADAHGLNQKAQLDGEFFAHALDARHQLTACVGVDQRDQAIANLQPNQIDLINVIPVEFFGFINATFGCRTSDACGAGFRLVAAAQDHEADTGTTAGQQQKDEVRHAGYQTQNGQNTGGDEEGGRVRQLRCRLLGHRLRGGDAGHDDGRCQRQEQGRDLRHQTIADGQQGVDAARFSQ